MILDREQAQFFARNGFVHVRGVIPADVCAHLVECTWEHLPAHWRRDDPDSWKGPVQDSCHVASLDTRGGLMKFASGCAGRSSEVRQRLYADAAVTRTYQAPSIGHGAAAALIGRPLHPIRLRGLFAIAPVEHPEHARKATSPHVEAHPAQLVAMTYLDEVAPGGGGVLVWPGSHRLLHDAFASRFDYVAGPDLAARLEALQQWQPVELCGGRGDLILMHHRLLHSPSLNQSRRIRFAFLCDYTPRDHQVLAQQPPGDLWADWPGLVELAGPQGLDGEPDFARVPVIPVPSPKRSWSLRAWWRAGSPAASSPDAERTANKREASEVGRMRRPGDVWLTLADVPELFDANERLDPRGSRLGAAWPWQQGVRMRCNGRSVRSLTQGGFTARLPVQPGRNVVELRGVPRQLWLRIVALTLPFSSSLVLVRRMLTAAPVVRVEFDVPATGSARDAARAAGGIR